MVWHEHEFGVQILFFYHSVHYPLLFFLGLVIEHHLLLAVLLNHLGQKRRLLVQSLLFVVDHYVFDHVRVCAV